MIEKAIIIRSLDILHSTDFSDYQRIYFGNENCPQHFPETRDVMSAIEFCAVHNLKFSLLSPLVLEESFEKITNTINEIPLECELIINDYGVFNSQKCKRKNIVMGRVIMPIKKDIRIDSATPVNRVSQYNPIFFDFYSSLGFARFELDNIQYNFFDKEPKNHIAFSLYYPQVITNVYISDCLKCANQFNENCIKFEKEKCNKTDEIKVMDNPKLIEKGNLVFYNSQEINQNLLTNINRLVFTNY